MASQVNSGSSCSAGLEAACVRQGDQSGNQASEHSIYQPPSCTFTETHILPHLQQTQYGQLNDAFFSHFPAAAIPMMAWQWPSNFGFDVLPCTASKQISSSNPGQTSNQRSEAGSTTEYNNQLGGFHKQLCRLQSAQHCEQSPHHQQYQYPQHFTQLAQGLEVHEMHAQSMSSFTGEQPPPLKVFGPLQSEVPPHLISRPLNTNANAFPENFLSSAAHFQLRAGQHFAGYFDRSNSDPGTPTAIGLRSEHPTTQSQDDKRDQRGQNNEDENAHLYIEHSELKFAAAEHAVSTNQRLFHAPTTSGPLNSHENCKKDEEYIPHHCASRNHWMPSLEPFANADTNDAASHSTVLWNGLQPVAAITASAAAAKVWSQVGASSAYSARCFQHAPFPSAHQVISTLFPSSSASATLSALFSSLQGSGSSTSLPSSSPFQLSAQSAFSYMSSTDYPKRRGCDMHCTDPAFTEHNARLLSEFQFEQVRGSVENARREDPNERVFPLIAGATQEPSKSCNALTSGLSSILAENAAAANGNSQAFVRTCSSYPTANNSKCPLSTPHAPEGHVSNDSLGCRLQRYDDNVRAPGSAVWRPSQPGIAYSSQGGPNKGGSSPPEFCNLLGQDLHILMRSNEYINGRDLPGKQGGALAAVPSRHVVDFPNTMMPCIHMSNSHEGPFLSAGSIMSIQRQPGVKGHWGTAEDRVLSKLVKRYGTRRWSLISTFIANRSGKQCRERWVNHLQPDIRKDSWTTEEEELLVHAHSIFGNRWSAIGKMLPGRTDNSIKNHWHAALRKKDSHGHLRPSLLREYIQKKTAACEMTKELGPSLATGPVEHTLTITCTTDAIKESDSAGKQGETIAMCITVTPPEPQNEVHKIVSDTHEPMQDTD